MSFFAAFLGFAMGAFLNMSMSPECKHGVHMHLIWQNPACTTAPGYHEIGGNYWIWPTG